LRRRIVSTRQGSKAAAREARLAQEAAALSAAAARRRLYALGGILVAVIVVVAATVAISSAGGRAKAVTGGRLQGAAFSASLFAGIPQHGTIVGKANAPVKLVEFADLQCPYCDEYSVQALPALVRDYVRTGKVSMQFENLSFIGPGSVAAGRAAAAAARQDRLWNFIDLMYLNQGEENSGYVTPSYLRRLLDAVPGLNVPAALGASAAPSAVAALTRANTVATQDGVNATPSFLIGKAGGPLRPFQPSSLTSAPFAAEFNALLRGSR
jgi:protein-disulfide isomerase